jgi:hypothetical protein
MRSNKAALLCQGCARILSGLVPRSWIYGMAILVLCLIASMVIATIKLI